MRKYSGTNYLRIPTHSMERSLADAAERRALRQLNGHGEAGKNGRCVVERQKGVKLRAARNRPRVRSRRTLVQRIPSRNGGSTLDRERIDRSHQKVVPRDSTRM